MPPRLHVGDALRAHATLALPEAAARNGKATLLKIYSPEGRLIADLSGRAMTGRNVTWDAAGIPAGLYVVKYTAGRRTWETKAVLAR